MFGRWGATEWFNGPFTIWEQWTLLSYGTTHLFSSQNILNICKCNFVIRYLFVFKIFQYDGTLTRTVSGVLTCAVRLFLGYGDSKSKIRAIRLNMFMFMFLILTKIHFVVLFSMQKSYSRTEWWQIVEIIVVVVVIVVIVVVVAVHQGNNVDDCWSVNRNMKIPSDKLQITFTSIK